MLSFITEDAIKYRVRELHDEAALVRPGEPKVAPEPETELPRTVLFRGKWILLDEIARVSGRF